MTGKPSCEELEKRIKQLEREAIEYVRKEEEFNEKRKLIEYGHLRRTISLMKINEELNREIKKRAGADEQELEQVFHSLGDRIKELNCLYDISKFGANTDFSLDAVLQAVIDFIPPAFQYPEITCARIMFDRYEFTTSNYKDTQWKLSQEIRVNNERIGVLEVCYLKEKSELEEGPFLNEARNLIAAVAETIAKIVEREWAEVEIRKCRKKIEQLIKQT